MATDFTHAGNDMFAAADAAPRVDPAAAKVVATLLNERHSCRAFLPEPLAPDVIETLLAMAQRTASWCNSQPWLVTILGGQALERVRAGYFDVALSQPPETDIPFPERYTGVYDARRRASAATLYASVGIEMGDREKSAVQTRENFRFFGAPHLALITTERSLGTYGALDCGAFVANFLIAASSLGIATIPQAAIALQSGFWHRELGIGEDRQVVCGISFGRCDPDHPVNSCRTDRATLSDVVRWVDE